MIFRFNFIPVKNIVENVGFSKMCLYFEIFTPEQSIIVSGQVLRMGICSFSVRREIFYISQTAAAAAVTFVVHVLLKTPACVERCKIFILISNQYFFSFFGLRLVWKGAKRWCLQDLRDVITKKMLFLWILSKLHRPPHPHPQFGQLVQLLF